MFYAATLLCYFPDTSKSKSIKSTKLGWSRGRSGNAFASIRPHFFKVTQPMFQASLKEHGVQTEAQKVSSVWTRK